MPTKRYNSSRRIGGHNWKARYYVRHIAGADGLGICPQSHKNTKAREIGVVCLWCTWIADAQPVTLAAAA